MPEPRSNEIKLLLPFLLILFFAAVLAVIVKTKPSAERREPPNEPQISVELKTVATHEVRIKIRSYGLVQPRVQSRLVAQVAGKIVYIDESAREGGFFEEGDLLIQIEPDDYQVEVEIAEANLADARARFEEELALAEIAEQDWKRSGNRGTPTSLVLRKPQLAAAEAAVKSAEANLNRAKLNLQRTQVRAPYKGRALSKNVDVGQVVGVNTELGVIYAVDAVEVRLPIKNSDLAFLDLPEFSTDGSQDINKSAKVIFSSSLVSDTNWEGRLVRTGGAVDENSRQLSVVARIDDPFGPLGKGKFPLKINQYVTAEIEGKVIPEALVIPNKAIYQGSYVYLYNEGVVNRRDISILWQDTNISVIDLGLKVGDQLVLTPLGQVASGTPVKIAEGQYAAQPTTKKENEATP